MERLLLVWNYLEGHILSPELVNSGKAETVTFYLSP